MNQILKYYYPVFSSEFIKSHLFLNMRTAFTLPTNQNILSFYHSIILSIYHYEVSLQILLSGTFISFPR